MRREISGVDVVFGTTNVDVSDGIIVILNVLVVSAVCDRTMVGCFVEGIETCVVTVIASVGLVTSVDPMYTLFSILHETNKHNARTATAQYILIRNVFVISSTEVNDLCLLLMQSNLEYAHSSIDSEPRQRHHW